MTGSILNDIKKLLGPDEEYDYFDRDLIIHINSCFSILHQLGVGPADPYRITGPENTWAEFLESKTYLEDVKLYIYLKTRIIFDPPANAFVVTSFENQLKEIEWRLHIADDDISDLTNGYGSSGVCSKTDLLDQLYKLVVKHGYTGTKEVWIKEFVSGGGGSPILKDDLIASIPAGGIKIGDKFLQGEELEALWRSLLDPVKNPTLTNPSVVIVPSGGTLLEVGEVKDISLIIRFDRGSINPPYGTSGYRAGEAIGYILNGVEVIGNTHIVTVSETNKTFNAEVRYAEGDQPKNSKGEDYDFPLGAGTTSSPILSFEFVDALWSNAGDITNITKEPLVSRSTGSKIFSFPPQTKINPEVFDVPASWNLKSIEVFNDITQRFEDDAREFTISTVTHQDAAGNDVEYKRYTDNRGYGAGERQVKITWT